MEDAATDLPMVELEEISECEIFGMRPAEAAACHAPFRAAFLVWLGEASGRLALPCSVDTTEPFCTGLHVPGLHPAIEIRLEKATDINVYVQWRDVWWDILISLDVYAMPEPDGSGWRDSLLMPEARDLHLTREACWRQDGFEWLLRWLNDDLATATHFVLCGGEDCYGEGIGQWRNWSATAFSCLRESRLGTADGFGNCCRCTREGCSSVEEASDVTS